MNIDTNILKGLWWILIQIYWKDYDEYWYKYTERIMMNIDTNEFLVTMNHIICGKLYRIQIAVYRLEKCHNM